MSGNRPVTVSEFVAAAGHAGYAIGVEAGKSGLTRNILESAVNRPGLALTGFFRHFAHRRIQVLGHSEHDYLGSLPEGKRTERLRTLFEMDIPCVVVTRNRKVMPEISVLAEEFGVTVLRSNMITGKFVNAATLVMENLRSPRTVLQGSMVEILGVGVLITGEPGIGKSEIALSLIKRGYSLVSDDVTAVRLDSTGCVKAFSPPATRYHMEIRGLGFIHVPSLFGVASIRDENRLDLAVHLERREDWASAGLSPHVVGKLDVLGVQIPRVSIPVAAGRDMGGLVEVATLDFKLKLLGHDASKEFDEKLIRKMTQGVPQSE